MEFSGANTFRISILHRFQFARAGLPGEIFTATKLSAGRVFQEISNETDKAKVMVQGFSSSTAYPFENRSIAVDPRIWLCTSICRQNGRGKHGLGNFSQTTLRCFNNPREQRISPAHISGLTDSQCLPLPDAAHPHKQIPHSGPNGMLRRSAK